MSRYLKTSTTQPDSGSDRTVEVQYEVTKEALTEELCGPLLARIATLEAALKPFAAAAEPVRHCGDDDLQYARVRHLRAAREALEGR